MNHRILLSSLLLTAVTFVCAPPSLTRTGTAQGPLPNGVASGDVTQTSAVLWARSQEPGMVMFEISTNMDFSPLVGEAVAEVTQPMQPVKVSIFGLSPDTMYYYRATDTSGATSQGVFKTSAAIGDYVGLRFGVSGDWRGELAPYPSIKNVLGRNLDFFVEHGDTIYADFPSPDLPAEQARTLDEYRIKHNEVFSARFGLNALADLREAMAVLATIDDHEVTNDFAGGAPPSSDGRFDDDVEFINDTQLFENGLQAFQEYNPIGNEFYGDTGDPRTDGERKLYRSFAYGSDAAVMVLDARSFRDTELPEVEDLTDPDQISEFLIASFDPSRTMLGRVQVEELKEDLVRWQQNGVTWKFVLIPEPIQNLSVIAASDRFEGYAAERTEILRFIRENNITNVVFVAADIHGTIINNLTYQEDPAGPQIPVDAFEVTTGPVAYDAPFGPTVVSLASSLGLISSEQLALYRILPRSGKDQFLQTLLDEVLRNFGYDPTGLDGSGIDAKLVRGGWMAVHSYGWTEFAIDSDTQQLRVITYGIDAYTQSQMQSNPNSIINRRTSVLSEFTVNPVR